MDTAISSTSGQWAICKQAACALEILGSQTIDYEIHSSLGPYHKALYRNYRRRATYKKMVLVVEGTHSLIDPFLNS